MLRGRCARPPSPEVRYERSSHAEAGPTWPTHALPEVTAPTLLIVGGNDWNVLEFNDEAADLPAAT